MNIREIVQKHLTEAGYGGLYCRDEPCGCTVADDLFPCGNDMGAIGESCQPGYVRLCISCPRFTEGNCPVPDGGYDKDGWCVGLKDEYPDSDPWEGKP